MKKINFKRLCTYLLCSGLVVGPTTMLATSCANNNNVVSIITFNNITKQQGQNLSFQTNNFKCDDILYGNNNISDGNYVLFLGSNTDKKPWPNWNMGTTNESWQREFVNSPIYQGFEHLINTEQAEMKKDVKDVAFLFYFDIHNCTNAIIDHKGKKVNVYKDDDKNEHSDISPFEKWSEKTFPHTLNNNEGWIAENDDKERDFSTSSYKEQYIRYDESAINFRNFIQRAQLLYPTNEQRKTTFSEKPTCAFFVNGKLVGLDDAINNETYWTNQFIKSFKSNYCLDN